MSQPFLITTKEDLLVRVKEGLSLLPLSASDFDDAAPKVATHLSFLLNTNGLNSDSIIFDFLGKIKGVVEEFREQGLTETTYLRAALVRPSLFYQSPTTIAANIRGVIKEFRAQELKDSAYLLAALKSPQLFYSSPATISANIRGVVEEFRESGLTETAYLSAALKSPSLFSQSPSTIAANIRDVVEEFRQQGLTETVYLSAALKQTSLFYLSPSTVAANIRGVVEEFRARGLTEKAYLQVAIKNSALFTQATSTVVANIRGVIEEFRAQGLTETAYLPAAIKQPSLFSLSPSTIAANIRGVVEEFQQQGLTEAVYLSAAIKMPQLFYQSPATICGHIRMAIQLYQKGAVPLSESKYGIPTSLEDSRPLIKWLMETRPIALTLADNNFVLRMAYLELFPRAYNDRNLLTVSRAKIESDVVRHFGMTDKEVMVHGDGYDPRVDYDHQDPTQHRHVLCRLIDVGLIKGLRLEPQPLPSPRPDFRRPEQQELINILCPASLD